MLQFQKLKDSIGFTALDDWYMPSVARNMGLKYSSLGLATYLASLTCLASSVALFQLHFLFALVVPTIVTLVKVAGRGNTDLKPILCFWLVAALFQVISRLTGPALRKVEILTLILLSTPDDKLLRKLAALVQQVGENAGRLKLVRNQSRHFKLSG